MLEFIQHAENSRIRIVEKYCSQVGTESSHVLEVFLRGVCIVEILQLEVCVPASPSSRPLHCHRHDLPGSKHLNVTKVPFAFYALQCVVLA